MHNGGSVNDEAKEIGRTGSASGADAGGMLVCERLGAGEMKTVAT